MDEIHSLNSCLYICISPLLIIPPDDDNVSALTSGCSDHVLGGLLPGGRCVDHVGPCVSAQPIIRENKLKKSFSLLLILLTCCTGYLAGCSWSLSQQTETKQRHLIAWIRDCICAIFKPTLIQLILKEPLKWWHR